MLKCPRCGIDNPDAALHCDNCGRDLAGAVVSRTPSGSLSSGQEQVGVSLQGTAGVGVACRSCGAQASADARFCPSCGESIAARQEYAGFWRRLGGNVVDSIITALLAGIPAFVVSFIILNTAPDVAFTQEQVQEQEDAGLIATLVSGAIYLLIFVGYYVFLNASGGTWGKRIFGMRLELADTGEDIGIGRALTRLVVSIASGLVLYVGYLWVIWDPRKQTWHDKAAGSVVVET